MSEPTQGTVAVDVQLKIGDGQSPEQFSLVPECKDFDGPEMSQEFADFTHQQSPAGFRERKPTYKSNSQITFTCNKRADDTQQDAMIAAANANPATAKNFQLIYPDGTTITFRAYISVRFVASMGNPLTLNCTLSLEGAFSIT
jgi:hypothetical protein